MTNQVLLVVLIIVSLSYTTNALWPHLKQKVVTFPAEVRERIHSAIKQCAGSEAKTTELMKIVQEGKLRDDDEFKRFIHCGYKKSGYAYEDGRVNIELSAPLYPDPVVMFKVMKRCDKETGKTPVDTTYEFFKCFQERSPFLIGK